ncbi:hypothetical protein Trydic_g18598 [Trypoxylus dichotomus]
MLTNIPLEFRKFLRHCEYLKRILRDTQNALEEIKYNSVLGEIKEHSTSFDYLRDVVKKPPALVVFGQNCHAKAIFINFILNESILPVKSANWRWVKFVYGYRKTLRLTLGHEYEIVDSLKAHEEPWTIVPVQDLIRRENEFPLDHCPTIEVDLCNSVLRENVVIIVTPDCPTEHLGDTLIKQLDNVLPILIYVISGEILTEADIQDIRLIKEKYSDSPILFINMSGSEVRNVYCETDEHFDRMQKTYNNLRDQLTRLGFLNEIAEVTQKRRSFCTECNVENNILNYFDLPEQFSIYIQEVLKANLLKMSALLSEVHNICLRIFILCAFDMAREIQITPRRIGYAQDVELKLFKSLMEIAVEKQEEIARLIQATLQNMRANISEVLEGYHIIVNESNTYPRSAKVVTMEIHQLVLRRLTTSVATQIVQSVGCLQESFTGTLQRCLESLERNCHELEGNLTASDAVKQIVNAAYNVDLKTSSSFSVQSLIDRLRKFVYSFYLKWPACAQPQFDKEWQTQVVMELLDSLSSSKLAKTISQQFQEHVKLSHEAFYTAMRFIENQLSGQLEQTEEQRIAIRKRHAPRFARFALESTSLCDLVRWGMPKHIKEIGRGQYGVVFACEPWGGINPCALKSVVPPDERHWNDLAMEFYYTRTIPEHPRIVKLRGSVIDHNYGSGCSSAVLLVMERMDRDLYWGLRSSMPWPKRIQIAIDVVEGIRYLHSQGLVHRDIKLKNVLLDANDRAKLTDFGFCIPEAMMSGSVVGTPVHMAPELLSGRYDSSVDVYAFGILFWYICAGQVQLPIHFEHFHSKEQLWSSVKKGMRPECLPHFDQACWNLMEQCWAAEPADRPLLGNVQPQLEKIQRESVKPIVQS